MNTSKSPYLQNHSASGLRSKQLDQPRLFSQGEPSNFKRAKNYLSSNVFAPLQPIFRQPSNVNVLQQKVSSYY